MIERIVPVLPINDYEKAVDFYVTRLGFEIDFEYRHEPGFPVQIGIKHGDVYMHLSEHAEVTLSGPEHYFFVQDMQTWIDRFAQHQVVIEHGPVDQPWGATEIFLQDPFHNGLRFSAPISK